MTWIVVSTEVLLGYSISGTSLNPAKKFGHALVLNLWHSLWIYFTAPIIGALLAAIAYRAKIFGTMELMTRKVFHQELSSKGSVATCCIDINPV